MNPESTILKHHQAGMVLIARVKIVKGVLGVVLGLGLLKLVHADVATYSLNSWKPSTWVPTLVSFTHLS